MKTLILMISLCFGLNAFASAQDASTVGMALGQAFVSELTAPEGKELIGKILGGSSYEDRVSIIDSEVDAALGTIFVSVTIGVDDLMDDDSGWGAVYRLEVKMVRDSEGYNYEITAVDFELIAG